jgi:sugar phosphate isomerase/epimerase
MESMELGMITTFSEGVEATLERVRELGLRTIQYLYLHGDGRSESHVEEIRRHLASTEIRITALFCTYADMDYSTIANSIVTGGLVPVRYRKERAEETKRIADMAASLGADAVALHYGAIPEDPAREDYSDLIETTQDLCEYCQTLGLTLNLETGEDTSETLLRFIGEVDRPNLGINFDPANMILYGKGEPIKALREVGPHVFSCHCKDATWSNSPGIEWGEETPLGQGEVDFVDFIRTLHSFDYQGPLTIEREIEGDKQLEDIRAAMEFLETVKAGILNPSTS